MKENKSEIKKINKVIECVDWIRLLLISLLIAYFIPVFILRPLHVDGSSMYPTLEDKEFVLSNIFANLTSSINRFDVVVAKEPESGELWVKRVIALPGESVEVKDGKLYIDGQYVEEPFLDEEYVRSQTQGNTTFTKDFSAVKLQENEYFLMGDNRNHSLDSRARGPFKREDIIGKHIYVLYPFSKARIVTNGNKN